MFFFSNLRSSTKKIMIATVYVSLIVQIITGLVQTHGLTFNFDSDDIILRDVLILETIVQFIEASFYIYVVYAISSMDMELVTPHRYFDWVITTPVMLVSTIMYMEYTKQSENKSDQEESIDGISFIKNNKENIGKIIIYNFLMLLFGYLGETNVISKYISNFIGFIFFGLSFHVIYSKYAYTVNTTEINKILFNLLIIIWALYGVAALFPTLYKNVSYNILDLFSKNFYGLFVYYNILKIKNII